MNRKAWTTTTICTVICLAILTTACSQNGRQGTSEQPNQKVIGMTCMDLSNPFFKLIAEVMRQEADKYGYELVALSGDLDPAKQNNQVYDFIVQEYDAIFLNPVDSRAAAEGVRAHATRGSPCSRLTSKSRMMKSRMRSSPTSAATTTRGDVWPRKAC